MMENTVILWCLMACVVLFGLMGWDKRRAQKGGRRVAEKTLFSWALLGGAAGGWLGMRVFRHKTRHWQFKFGFPLLTVLEGMGILWILLYKG